MESPITNGNGPVMEVPGCLPVWHLTTDQNLEAELAARRHRLEGLFRRGDGWAAA